MSESYDLPRPCLDSECDGTADPEEELAESGVLRWWTCRDCRMEFGYMEVKDDAAAGGCSLGIPEVVRAAASEAPAAAVFLGSTIGRRPQS